ncbi:MAG: carbamate kinase, partial [Bdellovibrionota bacterium]
PMPKEIIEKKLFRTLLSMGFIAIGAGGGGIPVYRKPDGEIRGIEAVIDKDRTSALLATDIGIDIFVILTEADHIYIDYKKPTEKALGLVHLSELDSYVKSGQFPDGSMGPKVGAAMSFVRNTGKKAIIANLFKLKDALDGKTGTTIIP